MLFALMQEKPILAIFLTGQDVVSLRDGQCIFARPDMLQGRYFNEVMISQHTTKDEVVKLIRQVDPRAIVPEHLEPTQPGPGEGRCTRCKGLSGFAYLFEDVCITCWAKQAKSLSAMSN